MSKLKITETTLSQIKLIDRIFLSAAEQNRQLTKHERDELERMYHDLGCQIMIDYNFQHLIGELDNMCKTEAQ